MPLEASAVMVLPSDLSFIFLLRRKIPPVEVRLPIGGGEGLLHAGTGEGDGGAHNNQVRRDLGGRLLRRSRALRRIDINYQSSIFLE